MRNLKNNNTETLETLSNKFEAECFVDYNERYTYKEGVAYFINYKTENGYIGFTRFMEVEGTIYNIKDLHEVNYISKIKKYLKSEKFEKLASIDLDEWKHNYSAIKEDLGFDKSMKVVEIELNENHAGTYKVLVAAKNRKKYLALGHYYNWGTGHRETVTLVFFA